MVLQVFTCLLQDVRTTLKNIHSVLRKSILGRLCGLGQIYTCTWRTTRAERSTFAMKASQAIFPVRPEVGCAHSLCTGGGAHDRLFVDSRSRAFHSEFRDFVLCRIFNLAGIERKQSFRIVCRRHAGPELPLRSRSCESWLRKLVVGVSNSDLWFCCFVWEILRGHLCQAS